MDRPVLLSPAPIESEDLEHFVALVVVVGPGRRRVTERADRCPDCAQGGWRRTASKHRFSWVLRHRVAGRFLV
jgi:hypothetical protein